MAEPVVIVGAGGFGRETADVIEAINAASTAPVWDLLGIVDDSPSDGNLERIARRGIMYLGTVDELIRSETKSGYVVGIGSPRIRRLVSERLDAADRQAVTLVHPDATVGSCVEMGEGTVILAGARVSTNITLGRHVHLNPNVTIGHDTVLEDFVSVNPASSVSGDCVIERSVLIGVAAVVLNKLRVGAEAVVGGAACVVRDVPAGVVVKGVPAR